jgi:hypothetical protein
MAAIAAIMVAILAAIFNMVAKTHKQFRNRLTDGRPAFPYPLLRFAGAGDINNQPTNMNNKCKTSYINHKYV